MQALLSVLLILQFIVVASHDLIDIPGWVHGSQVRAIVGRNKLVLGTLSTAIFPAIAAAFAVYFWNRAKPAYVATYWVVYCAVTVISAVAMWYIPYIWGTSEQTRRMYTQMYEGTRQVLPARGDNPRPNVFHIVLHVLFITTLVLAIIFRFAHS
jgi:hypothetical protein